MKRLLVILLALVYFAVSSGFTVHVHYCMGHRVGVSFLDKDGDHHTCSRCGMEKKKGNSCCKDEYKVFKSNPDQTIAKSLILPFNGLIADLPPAFPLPPDAARPEYAAVALPVAHGPPLPPGCPLYLKWRNLRL